MNHTQNYNLSQWVKSDQVRMEDFNADNAKIEAQLAWLKKKYVELAFHVGQLTAAESLHHDHYVSQRVMRCEGFQSTVPSAHPSGDLRLENHELVLQGPRASGSMRTNIVLSSGDSSSEVFLWLHRTGQQDVRVTPKLNGVEMTPLYNHPDFSAGKGLATAMLYAYYYQGAPLSGNVPFTLDITRESDQNATEKIYDFCLLYL